MAKKRAELVIQLTAGKANKNLGKLNKKVSAFSKFVKKASKDVKSFGARLKSELGKRFVITAGDIVGALKSIGSAVVDLVRLTGEFDGVETSFHNLAQSQGNDANEMLKNMQKLSAGTISNMELMKQANQGALLGLPVKRFGEMLNIARSAARATGQSMQFMLQSIVTGLGRQSKLMLDNLGIIIKQEDANKAYAKSLNIVGRQLTEAERKQAFINEALRIGNENVKKAGTGSLTLSEMMDKITASSENLVIALGQRLGPVFEPIIFGLSKTADGLAKFAAPDSVKGIEGIRARLKEVNEEADNLGKFTFKKLGKSVATAVASTVPVLGVLLKVSKQTNEEIAADILATQSKLQSDLSAAEDAVIAAEKAKADAKKLAALDAAETAQEEKLARIVSEQQAENALIGANEEQVLKARMRALDKQFKTEQTHLGRVAILESQAIIASRLGEIEGNKDKIKERDDFLSLTATLARSNNSTLAAIGKAAALTQIAIKTPEAISSSFAFGSRIGGPPLGFVFGGIAAAAMGAQAARVAGVALADGGIVPATSGGVSATIGEGGRSEAVIPLPDDFDPDEGGGGLGGGLTVIFQGPFLGDEDQGREFALFLDEQLTRLRQNNESNAFDEDII